MKEPGSVITDLRPCSSLAII